MISCDDPIHQEELPSDEVQYTQMRATCGQRSALRNLYFGDLHYHTTHSWDAYGYDLTVTPAESYRFARGDSVLLPPLNQAGQGTREVRLERPLDFAAATDHAEFLGETLLCRTPGSAAYDSSTCAGFREGGAIAVSSWGMRLIAPEGNLRLEQVCGADGVRCQEAAKKIWGELQGAAESADDRSAACTFTSFIGYEYTATPLVTNLHRNVIFRNAQVPELPLSYFEAPTPWELWTGLQRQCLEGGQGCDTMVIPHNSNWSNGTLFFPDFGQEGDTPEARAKAAALRARMEPVMETFQHKGDMECQDGLSGITGEPDSRCANEKIRFPPYADCGDDVGWGGVQDQGCISRLDFLRGVLLEGLKQQGGLGLNPYQVGILASTDSHNGTPGNTRERGWPGHVGVSDDTVEERMGEGNITHRGLVNNPGGLAAVWAVENSRDAIFEALRRREIYATSGTRVSARFFGGWGYPDSLCGAVDLVETGYRRGVPMGGILRPRAGATPTFVLDALQDPGTTAAPGSALQSAQIIKGWLDGQGQAHIRVFEVAGDPQSAAAVDPETCLTQGAGAERLCTVWQDPEFDPALRAFYYARVLENPTCRWSTWECIALAPELRPAGCQDPNVQPIIQERAWTSPIWYEPTAP